MRKFKAISGLSLLLFTHFYIVSNAQWYWQNPLPQGNDLYKAVMLSPGTIVACGAGSTVIKSENNGWDWNLNYLDETDTLLDIGFFDNSNGIAVPKNGCIYLTDDAGKNWEKGSQCYTCCLSKAKIDVVDEEACFLMACGIYYSDDKGYTWNQRVLPSWGDHEDISFADRQTGWILMEKIEYGPYGEVTFHEDRLYKTADGGFTWELLLTTENLFFTDFMSIFLVNPVEGYLYTNLQLSKTSDAGETWTDLQLPYGGHRGLYVLDENNIWIIINDNGDFKAYRSNDGGESWIEIDNKGVGYYFYDQNNGVAWNGYRIYSTSDGGMNWEDLTTDQGITDDISDVFFVDDSTGWAWGDGVILKTCNEGLEWSKIYTGPKNINKIHFFDRNHGLMSQEDFPDFHLYLYESFDGGLSWDSLEVPMTMGETILDFWAFSADTFWIAEPNTQLYCTRDGGNTWEDHSLWIWDSFNYLYFLNNDTAWAACDYSILKTTDGWETFTEQLPESTHPWEFVGFSDADRGIAWSYEDFCYSADGGDNWQIISHGRYPEDIQWLQDGIVYNLSSTVSNYGLDKSIDGGQSWTSQRTPSKEIKGGIFFLNNEKGWITDKSGRILHNNKLQFKYRLNTYPSSLNFPSILAGSPALDTLHLINSGDKTIRIDSIVCHEAFWIWESDGSAWVKVLDGFHLQHSAPDNQAAIMLKFDTNSPGEYVDTLLIISSLGLTKVVLSGNCIDNSVIYEVTPEEKINPNPCNGQFRINQSGISEVKVYDLQGRPVEFDLQVQSNHTRILIDYPESGVYLVSWKSGELNYSTKILITN